MSSVGMRRLFWIGATLLAAPGVRASEPEPLPPLLAPVTSEPSALQGTKGPQVVILAPAVGPRASFVGGPLEDVPSSDASSKGARRGPRASFRMEGPKATLSNPTEVPAVDAEVRRMQAPVIPSVPRPRVPSGAVPSTSAPEGPRARFLPPTPSPSPAPTPAPTTSPVDNANPPAETSSSVASAPTTPDSTTDDSFARAPASNLAGDSSGSGAAEAGFNYSPVMLGDQAPAMIRQLAITGAPPIPQPPVPGQPPTPPSPFAGRNNRTTTFVPWARGFKVADNQSPIPQDRFFYTFDYFNNLGGEANRRAGSVVSSMQAYRQLLGIEKTFLQGNASIGIRLPINTLWTSSRDATLRGNDTAVGNMTIFSKYVLWADRKAGNLVSGGLAITVPNGPTSFAGAPGATGFHDAQFQPFVGYIFHRGKFFVQGFTAIDVPTDSRDVTMWYNDAAIGYYAYRSADPSAFLTAIIPTFELHLSDPLNHRGMFRPNDPAGSPDVLDITVGSSFVFHKRVIASLCCAFPVTGPHPFDVEALALLNVYYGPMGGLQAGSTPPIAGR